MNQHDAEDEQTKREREEESDRDREDRAVILARRQLLIASAMAGGSFPRALFDAAQASLMIPSARMMAVG